MNRNRSASLYQPYFIQGLFYRSKHRDDLGMSKPAALFTASTPTNKRSPSPARPEQDGVSNSAQAPAGHSPSATSEPIPVEHRNAAAEKHIAAAVPEPVQERTRQYLKGWRLYVLIFAIVFRAFQGIGASGIYAMVTVIQPELVPPEKWGNLIAVTSMVFVLSSVLGPVLGGVINQHSSWRWVFLLNAPAGVLATGLIIFSMPNNFPNIQGSAASSSFRAKFSRASFARLDIMGATLLLFSSVLIVFAFEEAGSRYGWVSPAILSSLTIGASLFVAFIVWERFVAREKFRQEPIFPLRLMKDRIFAGLIMLVLNPGPRDRPVDELKETPRVAFFTGPPFMTVLINLPQRFQAVDGASAFEAGLRLLPLLLASPVATAVSGQLAGRFKIPPFYLLLFATSLQLVGVGLASSVQFLSGKEMYGYEAIMGFGFGMGLVSLLIFTPIVVDRTDMGVAMGAITQIRVLGGTIGLAIRQIFADGYNAQMRAMLYFNVVVFISAIILWERKPRSAATMQGY
ncbi:hypothetical protein DL765_009175 [Monosporascus sp. GIB2]|nr:hypothetical protein DL765_009175 [Monosporascus sp. GIB2]